MYCTKKWALGWAHLIIHSYSFMCVKVALHAPSPRLPPTFLFNAQARRHLRRPQKHEEVQQTLSKPPETLLLAKKSNPHRPKCPQKTPIKFALRLTYSNPFN
ncbi:hypothetical protein GOP47_0030370 [Adiantum capillus-veneris]|nr:hypothetical protein GOP47_0030370 [Adiantum capillus-veneris]